MMNAVIPVIKILTTDVTGINFSHPPTFAQNGKTLNRLLELLRLPLQTEFSTARDATASGSRHDAAPGSCAAGLADGQ